MSRERSDRERPLVLTVTQLNREVKGALEGWFPHLSVSGEIANLSRPASGHLYFTLRDQGAQLRCALFRNQARSLRMRPDNGMQVVVSGRIGLYEARGDYQLIADSIDEGDGEGALRRAFDLLRQKLEQEGLLDPARKRPLPRQPRTIGVVTSATGAALRDILTTLQRRFPTIGVILYPTLVQGEGAAESIARMIAIAAERRECDVLIVGRGGGSLEDLWAFNEEVVARAIVSSGLPVVSAVGHEIDMTISDLVADRRAATPTAAAELLSPDKVPLLARLTRSSSALKAACSRSIVQRRQRLETLFHRLQLGHPQRRLEQHAQKLDELGQRLERAWFYRLSEWRGRRQSLFDRLMRHHPQQSLVRHRLLANQLGGRLLRAAEHQLERKEQRLHASARTLHGVSPLATLGRGYAIVRAGEGRVVRRAADLQVGQQIETLLGGDSRIVSRVEEVFDGQQAG